MANDRARRGEAALAALAAFARAPDRGRLDAAIAAATAELAPLLGAERVYVLWGAEELKAIASRRPGNSVPIVVRDNVQGWLHWETAEGRGIDPAATAVLAALADGIGAAASRLAAEAGWRETDDRLQSLIQGTTDALWCYESPEGIPIDIELAAQLEQIRDMILVEANLAYARVRGVPGPESMLGKRMREIAVTPEHGIRVVYDLLVANDYRRVSSEVESTGEGGARHLVIEASAVLRNRRLYRLWGSIRDVTEQRRADAQQAALERQLQHAQKLESVGLLAGGIAHDFNNLLTVITSAARFADIDLENNPARARESLGLVTEATGRAAELTRRLLAFSRHEPTRREVLDANRLARDILKLLRRLVPERVDIALEFGEGLGLVEVDATQFEQALVNLCVNAADAIPEVGQIVIRTADVRVGDDQAVREPGATPGRYVCVSVSDTGVGIPPEERERIFEPFYTTKGNAAGTGLGLSVVYGIVHKHGGFIQVESEPGLGSTFRLYYPVSHARSITPAPLQRPGVIGGTETILVVEDEELVREVVERVLKNAGYRLIVAGDGEEAVRLFEHEGDGVDLVLLDAVLPVMSGREVYERLVAHSPGVNVLFTSGYTGGALPHEFLDARGLKLVNKPYQADTLLRAIREALDARRA